jgi:hypothetical protein
MKPSFENSLRIGRRSKASSKSNFGNEVKLELTDLSVDKIMPSELVFE